MMMRKRLAASLLRYGKMQACDHAQPQTRMITRVGAPVLLHGISNAAASSNVNIPCHDDEDVSKNVTLVPHAAPENALLKSIASDIRALQDFHHSLVMNPAAMDNFEACLARIRQCHEQNRTIHVTGVGKSGIVARRLASTLSSISIRSQWTYGGDWMHGDLGGVSKDDVIIIFSHSGKTSELLALPHLLQRTGGFVIAIVGDPSSPLSRCSDLALLAPANDEAGCPVPSRSIIVQEATCNAIVECLVANMDDRASNFRRNHPGGFIGAQFSNNEHTE